METINFWRLNHPQYQTQRQEEYINGYGEHPYGLPGIDCKGCGEIWSNVRILPISCPEEYRKNKHITNVSPTPDLVHRNLQSGIAIAIGQKEFKFLPGDEFQPIYLDIKTKPKADFLWSTLGSVLVSERIKNEFEHLQLTGIQFAPVTMRKVGDKLIKYPFEIKHENEFYYEMIITSYSKSPSGAEIITTCEYCGREAFDRNKRRIEMKQDMWNGQDVFFLNTTIWIIVTDRVKKVLQELEATNIVFESLS